MFDRHRGRAQHVVELGHVQEEDGDEEREGDGREEVPVESVLQQGEAARAQREQVEPLHDHQIDEVDGAGLVEDGRGGRAVHAGGRRAEAEPQRREVQALPLAVPVGHGEGGDGLDDTGEAVGLHDQLPVDEAIALGVARRAGQHVGFWGFVGDCCGGGAVGEAADDDHEEAAEDLRQAEDDACDDGPELGEAAGGEEVGDGFLEVVVDDAAVLFGGGCVSGLLCD